MIELRQLRVVVAAGVTRSYARICAANMSLAAARRVAEIQHATLDVAERLARGGRGTRFDMDRARAAAHSADAAVPDLLAERRAALFELAALMGRPPADYPREAETCSIIPTVFLASASDPAFLMLAKRGFAEAHPGPSEMLAWWRISPVGTTLVGTESERCAAA